MEEDILWYDLMEDYFGVHVNEPVRWERELNSDFPNLTNEDLCNAIRSASRSTWDLKRKANLGDLSGWVRSRRGAECESTGSQACERCENGWMSFSYSHGKVVVWESSGSNGTSCPCTCPAGRVHSDRMIARGETTLDRMEQLQDKVLDAMVNPQVEELQRKEVIDHERNNNMPF